MTEAGLFQRSIRTVLAGVLALVLCAAALDGAGAEVQIGVEGNSFTKNGLPWIPKGFVIVGLVAPAGRWKDAEYEDAARQFGLGQVTRARALGADLVRYQVSQWGLDPLSPIYDPNYLGQVLEGVRLARSQGLAIILSMQWQRPAGLARKKPMPTAATFRAWAQLAPFVANDKDVMLQLFNEPGPHHLTSDNWRKWQAAHQALLEFLRDFGAKNVLIAGGPHGSRYLNPEFTLNDPLQRIGYAIHPYLGHNGDEPKEWDANFGNFSRHYPVLATEWNMLGRWKPKCPPKHPDKARRLLKYLKNKNIGLIAWALDINGTILWNGRPTNFTPYLCDKDSISGAGELIIDSFKN